MTYGVGPCTGTSGEIPATGIPFYVCDAIMVGRGEQLDASAPVLAFASGVVETEVQVPEFQLRLAGRTNGSQNDVTPTRRPANNVAGTVRQSACEEYVRRYEAGVEH